MAKHRLVRRGDYLRDDEVVVRGGALDLDRLRINALRNHSIYGFYGLSVFAVRGETSLDELAQRLPLVRFEHLTLMTAGAIRSAGLTIEPTGANPHHFDIVAEDLDEADNPYSEALEQP